MAQGSAVRIAVLGLITGLGAYGSLAKAEDVTINGFLSTGIDGSNRSQSYGQKNIRSTPSLTNETVLGLNLAKPLSDTTKVAAQLVAEESNADSAVKAEWLFLTYHPIEPISLTIGKQKLPVWMVSPYPNVGVAYPWARLPDEVYSLFNLTAFTGASIRYDLKIAASTLAIEALGGGTTVEAAPNAPTTSSQIHASDLFGGDVEWTLGKTRIRAAYVRARWDLNLGSTVQFGERDVELASVGLSTKAAGFLLMTEYASLRDRSQGKYEALGDSAATAAAAAQAAGDNTTAASLTARASLLHSKLGGSGYYLTGGYQLALVTVLLTYASLTKEPKPTATNDQRSTTLGFDFDLTADSVVKLEGKRLSIPSHSTGLFTQPVSTAGLDGAVIYTVNYSLVF